LRIYAQWHVWDLLMIKIFLLLNLLCCLLLHKFFFYDWGSLVNLLRIYRQKITIKSWPRNIHACEWTNVHIHTFRINPNNPKLSETTQCDFEFSERESCWAFIGWSLQWTHAHYCIFVLDFSFTSWATLSFHELWSVYGLWIIKTPNMTHNFYHNTMQMQLNDTNIRGRRGESILKLKMSDTHLSLYKNPSYPWWGQTCLRTPTGSIKKVISALLIIYEWNMIAIKPARL